MPQEQFWRDFVYIQRDVEDKDQFSKNWDLIFPPKKKEETNANNENNTEVGQDRL